MTEEVVTDIRRAINALPLAHQVETQDGDLVDNPSDGYIHFQDWAFTQGFGLVNESSQPERWILNCIHHHDKTRNYCKIEEKDWKLALTLKYAAGIITRNVLISTN